MRLRDKLLQDFTEGINIACSRALALRRAKALLRTNTIFCILTRFNGF